MYKSGYVIKTTADFDNDILFELKTEVWQNGQIIDYAGVIESHTNDFVSFMNESKYLKPLANSEFAKWLRFVILCIDLVDDLTFG
jgi:hypothetical protein